MVPKVAKCPKWLTLQDLFPFNLLNKGVSNFGSQHELTQNLVSAGYEILLLLGANLANRWVSSLCDMSLYLSLPMLCYTYYIGVNNFLMKSSLLLKGTASFLVWPPHWPIWPAELVHQSKAPTSRAAGVSKN